MNVKEFAAEQDISERRVRQLIAAGKISAVKNRGKWNIQTVSRKASTRRPLSNLQQDDLLAYFFNPTLFMQTTKGYRKSRTLGYVGQLERSARPDELLLDWFQGSTPEGPAVAAIVRELRTNGTKYALPALKAYLHKRSPIAQKASVGARAEAARLKSGLSRSQAAAMANSTVKEIKNIENTGTVPGGVLQLRRYLDLFGEHPTVISVPNIREV